MPLPILAVAAGALAAKAASKYFGGKAKKKQEAESNRANTAALNLQQKQQEDARRSRVELGSSLLNGVPSTTAGGAVNTNVGLDPALVEKLMLERKYDFGSTMRKPGTGAGSAFLSGLFGDIGDFATSYGAGAYGAGRAAPTYAAYGAGANPTTISWQDLLAQYNAGAK